MAKDYYQILGIVKNASQEEIKKSFRKKAHQYHPDKSVGNETKFKEVNGAYQVLGNFKKRLKYDKSHADTFISEAPISPKKDHKINNIKSTEPDISYGQYDYHNIVEDTLEEVVEIVDDLLHK